MNKSNPKKRIVVLLLYALLIVAQAVVFWNCWDRYYSANISRIFFAKGHMLLVLVYVLLFSTFANVYGAMKISKLDFGDLVFSQLIVNVFVNMIMYFQICLLSYKLVHVAPIIGQTVQNMLVAFVWAYVAITVYKMLYPPRDILLVYCDRDPDNLVSKINSRQDKYIIKKAIHINSGYKAVCRAMKKHDSVLLCDIPAHIRNDYIKYCYQHNIRVYVTPKLSDIILMGSQINNLFDSPLLLLRNKGLKWEEAFLKRAMDIVIISVITIITFIPMMLIALAIKIEDRGPVFYKQQRLTLDGNQFYIYKFRSMKMDSEEKGARLCAKDDDRVTHVGKILRKAHLDELPQIINILKGEMSIVGPRPERPEIAAQYCEGIPEFSFRLKVKAGLTGYAQVYGKYNTTPYDKLKLDLHYIENYSFWLDIKLILMTFKIIFDKGNTEGVDVSQTTATITKDVLREKDRLNGAK
ncbi:MAG: exopolysaccharide biosynthesis polyprenyl glycosylphosphotransferase [Lachnospiraceae bacterium]|nr:exopolysaccharide biosynthesis polyprenyl glycosylphosphotransferase [Lachnospiraceae bacterium]